MTFFDEEMNSYDVTMQELQLAAQEQYNYSLIGEQSPNKTVAQEALEETTADLFIGGKPEMSLLLWEASFDDDMAGRQQFA